MQTQEAEWLAKAQKGDDEAFSRLVEAYQGPVYNVCYRMLGNAGDAEDAAQEAFLRAYKAIKRYDPNRKFSTWLLTIASNYCIDQHRRKRLPSFSIEDTPTQDVPDTSEVGMDFKMIANERQAEVQMLLETLSPKDRAAIVMLYWYDYSYEEIAESLSLTVSAVKSRLHRARRELAGTWMEREPVAIPAERTQHGSSTI